MCVAIPGEVIAIMDGTAEVEVRGRRRRVSALLVPELRAGDRVLIANGMIVERLTEEEAGGHDEIFAAMLEAIDETA